MSTASSNSRPPSRPSLAPGAHGRVYIFSVVVLALFFGCVVFWRQPPHSHTARVVLEQTGRHERLDAKAEIVAEIIAIHCDHAEDDHCGDGHSHDDAHGGHDHDPAHPSNAAQEQPHLLVDVQEDDDGKRITIWCASAQAQAAREEAGLLAQRYGERVSNPIVNHKANQIQQQAKTATASARNSLAAAEVQLNAFREEHADAFSSDASEKSQPQVEPPPAENNIAAEQLSLQPHAEINLPESNPAWMELDERLQVLRAARQELLASKTESHPQVRDLQWQVEKLEAEIALMPPTLEPARTIDDEPPHTVVAPEANDTNPDDPINDEPSPALLARLDDLQAAVAAARRTLQQAQAEERRAAASAQLSPSTAIATIVEPATIVSTRGGGASRSAVFGGGLLAMFAGLLIAWRSQRVRQPAALISTLQIESLGAPVVAAIATGDGPELPTPQISNPRPIAWFTFTCELIVAAIAVAMLLLALADWQTAGQMMNDPLSTFGEALSRLW